MKPKGFTLLELLIVIFIVGILSSAIFVKGTSLGIQKAKWEAQRLKNLLIYAEQQAIVNAYTLQLSTNHRGYQFLRYIPPSANEPSGKWSLRHKDTLLNYYTLPSKVKLVVSSGDVIFFPTGDCLPFQIDFYFNHTKMPYYIIGKKNGEITFVDRTQG